jgi:hypothetical protein
VITFNDVNTPARHRVVDNTETPLYIGFTTGFRGDLFHIALTVGGFATWTFLSLSIAFSIYAITVVIGRFKGFPQEAAKVGI